MSSETSLLNNIASPVLGYDLMIELNRLKMEIDQTDIKNIVKQISDLGGQIAELNNTMNDRFSTVEINIDQLVERVTALESSVDGLPSRVANIEVNINILSESLNALDDRVKALEGGS